MLKSAKITLGSSREELMENRREVNRYLAQLGRALEVIKQECGETGWWVVGGLANEAYFGGSDFEYRCNLHGLRDLDILCCKDLLPGIYKARRQNPTPVFIDVAYHSLLQVFTTKKAWLRRGKTELPIPAEVFETQFVPLMGLTIPTLPPQTLQHIYCVAVVMCGPLRPKDFRNARELGKLAAKGGNFPTYPHKVYENWHLFLKKAGKNPGLMLTAFRVCKRLGLKRILPLDHPVIQPLMQRVWDAGNDG